jgi:hypothetical protein
LAIRRRKTDQEQLGQEIAIPHGSRIWPVKPLMSAITTFMQSGRL